MFALLFFVDQLCVYGRYSVEEIARSNAHLAHDMLQRAISKKNSRIEKDHSSASVHT